MPNKSRAITELQKRIAIYTLIQPICIEHLYVLNMYQVLSAKLIKNWKSNLFLDSLQSSREYNGRKYK